MLTIIQINDKFRQKYDRIPGTVFASITIVKFLVEVTTEAPRKWRNKDGTNNEKTKNRVDS